MDVKEYLNSFNIEDQLISQKRYVINKKYMLSELLDYYLEVNNVNK